MTASLPHVVHVIDELPPDGAERLLADMLRHRSSRFRFSVACLVKGGGLEQEIRDMGVPVTVFGRRGSFDPGLVIRLARWFRRERVDVVHTHLFMADSFGRVAARLAGIRAVFSTAHNTVVCEGKARRTIHRALSWASTKVIACSGEVGKVMREQDKLCPSNLLVIPNGIDIDRLSVGNGEGVRAEFAVPDDALLIGVIGRLHPAKGHTDLFAALARLRAGGHKPVCLVIGSGNSREELEAECKRLGISDQVVFTGQRKDVPRLLAGLDILAMPSRWEGLPIALLEAMAKSRPIVATRVSGIPEVIQDQDNGLLVQPADPVALAEALQRLLSDPPLRERLGKRANETLRERYDVARTARAYEALYAEALGLPPDNPGKRV